MSDEKNDITRRRALKVLAVGVGTATALPVLGQEHAHHGAAAKKTAEAPAAKKDAGAPKFFTAPQMALVTVISEMIIPTDEHSPGAKAAEVPAFIDLMLSESPEETKVLWRDGLAAMDKMSRAEHSQDFAAAQPAQQVAMLTKVSANERDPKTTEEKFFRAIKNLTIDGYYTSEIGIQQDLQYKGNAYLKEFKGCTHPEHQNS